MYRFTCYRLGLNLLAVGSFYTDFDEACERSGLPVPAVTGALLTLTLRAVVVEGPAGFFRRARPPSGERPRSEEGPLA